jgi:hypothetical protein
MPASAGPCTPGAPQDQSGVQSGVHSRYPYIIESYDAPGIDAGEHLSAAPGPFGDFSGGNPGDQPPYDACVTEVVRALHSWRSALLWCVVPAEAFGAYELRPELGRSVRLDSKYKVVPPPGLVDLNRSDL